MLVENKSILNIFSFLVTVVEGMFVVTLVTVVGEMFVVHSVHCVSTPPPPLPQKHYPLFLTKPPLNLQTVPTPFFR